MKHKLLLAAAATALLAAPTLAAAQDAGDAEGFYVRGQLGYGALTDSDLTSNNLGFVGDVEAEGNLAGSLGLGYDFGAWRFELDGLNMFNDLGRIDNQPSTFAKTTVSNYFLNAIYDMEDFGRFAPYVGAGIGLIDTEGSFSAHDFLNADGTVLVRNPACLGPRLAFNQDMSCQSTDTGSTFGYQLLAGLGYDITDNLTWDTSYRYFDGGDIDIDGDFYSRQSGASAALKSKLEDISGHVLLTGFRYRFGDTPAPVMVAPPPPPVADFRCWDGSMVFNAGQCPPEPVVEIAPQPEVRCWDGSMVFDQAQCPAEPVMVQCPDGSMTSDISFCESAGGGTIGELCDAEFKQEIIYYEFDRGQSAETRNTIARILDTGQYCDVQSIRVVGHTDTSGAASYNLALSKRRAKDAVDELVRQGIRREVISSDGKGETEPFVQTGDGVKEQLNRRTEVLITLGSVGVLN